MSGKPRAKRAITTATAAYTSVFPADFTFSGSPAAVKYLKAAISTKTTVKMMRNVKSQPTTTLQMKLWKPERVLIGAEGAVTARVVSGKADAERPEIATPTFLMCFIYLAMYSRPFEGLRKKIGVEG